MKIPSILLSKSVSRTATTGLKLATAALMLASNLQAQTGTQPTFPSIVFAKENKGSAILTALGSRLTEIAS